MLYTIQNAFGEVYGGFPFPDVGLTTEEWVWKLRGELGDILGWNGIKASELVIDSRTGERVERVVVDIDPVWDYQERLDRVHSAVTFIALCTPPGET